MVVGTESSAEMKQGRATLGGTALTPDLSLSLSLSRCSILRFESLRRLEVSLEVR